jgi:HEAT repeat protein
MLDFGITPHFLDRYVSMVKAVADVDCVPILLDALYHGEFVLTVATARALGAMGKVAMPSLVKVLRKDDSEDWVFASNAARALDVLDDPECVPELEQLLSSKIHTVGPKGIRGGRTTIGYLAESTLERIGTKEAIQVLEKWRKRNK